MYNMMIVEDEPLIRKGLARMVKRLSSEFYVVKEACCAEEALAYLETAPVDVVISDIRMGDMDGAEMAGILAREYPETVVVLLSGYSDFTYAQKAIEGKVFSYLLKPLDEKQLLELLENVKGELEDKARQRQKSHLMELHVKGNISYLFWLVKQKELVFYMESGQEEKVGEIAEDVFSHMEKNKLPIYVCRQLTLELLNLILNSAAILTAAEKQELIEAFCQEENLASVEDMEALKEWFVLHTMEAFSRFSRRDTGEKRHVVEEIQAYIEENYGRELSLTKVADQFNFNSFYLSNLFKVYAGSNFLEFVNQTRVRKAIELLKNENLKIYEIAERVGYQNVNSFSILFKKYTGLTPGNYQKKLKDKR